MSFFLAFYPPNSTKNQNFEEMKKLLEISSFYICVQYRWCTVPEICCAMDRRMDGRMDGRTDRRRNGKSGQKKSKSKKIQVLNSVINGFWVSQIKQFLHDFKVIRFNFTKNKNLNVSQTCALFIGWNLPPRKNITKVVFILELDQHRKSISSQSIRIVWVLTFLLIATI